MLDALKCRIIDWWQQDLALRKLEAVDDRLLADMGVSRKDIGRFVATRKRRPSDKSGTRHSDAAGFSLECSET